MSRYIIVTLLAAVVNAVFVPVYADSDVCVKKMNLKPNVILSGSNFRHEKRFQKTLQNQLQRDIARQRRIIQKQVQKLPHS